ncbi:SPOR domain-containing protein [Halotalea alkalilenta]|uniref:SPOR domain-containing protein n=1 Tax=Halotalea alkalilenta TaxID=376489 RepID=UPI000486C202|nr:SPOR domain-containing protein [Halotalea alkalilenta]
MKYGIRERIIGGIILIALAVIVVPMFFGSPSERESGPGPTMTINQQPIEVPQRDIAPPQSELFSAPDDGSDSTADVSQYAQLLPEEAPSGNGPTVEPEAAASAGAAQEPAPAASMPAEPTPITPVQAPERPAPPPQQAQAPAPSAPARAPERPAAAPPQQAQAPSRSESSASQGSGSLASSDPIMAAANRYRGDSGASSSSTGSSSSAAAPSSGNWSVQAGSFGQGANADRLVEQLRGLGFAAYKISRGANSVVMVGPFQSSEAGESARQQLQQRANINGFVVRNTGNAG